MTGVEDHDALVGQHDECGVVVVVGLEVGPYEHICLSSFQPVVLSGFHVAVNIDIADVGGVDGSGLVLIMERTRVGKPAPCTLVSHNPAAELCLGKKTGDAQRHHRQKNE